MGGLRQTQPKRGKPLKPGIENSHTRVASGYLAELYVPLATTRVLRCKTVLQRSVLHGKCSISAQRISESEPHKPSGASVQHQMKMMRSIRWRQFAEPEDDDGLIRELDIADTFSGCNDLVRLLKGADRAGLLDRLQSVEIS